MVGVLVFTFLHLHSACVCWMTGGVPGRLQLLLLVGLNIYFFKGQEEGAKMACLLTKIGWRGDFWWVLICGEVGMYSR